MNKVSKKIIGITGSNGALGSKFIKKYKAKFIFKIFKERVENKKKFDTWIKKNSNIQAFIHLAAISSVRETNKNYRLAIHQKISSILGMHKWMPGKVVTISGTTKERISKIKSTLDMYNK